MLSFLALTKSKSLPSSLSMLLKVYWVPCVVSTSKSKERVVVVPRAKLIKEISSKRMCPGGLWT